MLRLCAFYFHRTVFILNLSLENEKKITHLVLVQECYFLFIVPHFISLLGFIFSSSSLRCIGSDSSLPHGAYFSFVLRVCYTCWQMSHSIDSDSDRCQERRLMGVMLQLIGWELNYVQTEVIWPGLRASLQRREACLPGYPLSEVLSEVSVCQHRLVIAVEPEI